MSVERFTLIGDRAGAPSTLAEDVRRGLVHPRPGTRWLPPKHFYDARGSELFDRICELDEYYPTRAEHALLERTAASFVEEARAGALLEIGSGMARKTGLLVEALVARTPRPLYVPFDIAPAALEASAAALLPRFPTLTIRAIVGEFPRDLPRFARAAPPAKPDGRLFAFLGSTIGNLDEREAPALVRAVCDLMAPEDAFLLGVDLVKDRRTLVAAYDDALGVTAAFDKNVLAVMNRELGADFDLDAFDHEAVWDDSRARIEMRLVSTRAQRVRFATLDLEIALDAGERILTEISRKFTRASAERTLEQGGLALVRWETDGPFALALARKTEEQETP